MSDCWQRYCDWCWSFDFRVMQNSPFPTGTIGSPYHIAATSDLSFSGCNSFFLLMNYFCYQFVWHVFLPWHCIAFTVSLYSCLKGPIWRCAVQMCLSVSLQAKFNGSKQKDHSSILLGAIIMVLNHDSQDYGLKTINKQHVSYNIVM